VSRPRQYHQPYSSIAQRQIAQRTLVSEETRKTNTIHKEIRKEKEKGKLDNENPSLSHTLQIGQHQSVRMQHAK
jgi:hypothetical protein